MSDIKTIPDFSPPICTSDHCRHYSFDLDGFLSGTGPRCAKGIDISGPGEASPCLPAGSQFRARIDCPLREDYTDEERVAWRAWVDESHERVRIVMAAIPKGQGGVINCPACKVGRVHWSRSPRNGHLHAQCTTPNCFSVMQ
ncbi:hypothetical protein [Chelatococcus sp. XZ-Ab1]|uniref:hypothetical protein n=1 Tax=Chelatococcus sp. XZ-Ab1 TaxID=3034027 RepID=UPI0023E43C3F|nr:hypothetical protein [Chelatococcus sp. XZ-Ab1]